MKKKMTYILILICIFAIAGCTSKNEIDGERLPGIDIPINEFNTMVWLEAVPGMTQVHKDGESLTFLVRNGSKNSITFAQDFSVKIFIKEDTTWKPIENTWGYPEGENILPPSDIDPTGMGLSVMPDVGEIDELTTVRIAIIGQLENKPEPVGAFIDIQYSP